MLAVVSGWLDWLEASSPAVGIRQSLWLYPALEIVHITGIVILAGAAFMFDLRLLGTSKKLPFIPLGDYLLPWSRRGLWLIIPSGILLFITNASTLGVDPTFFLKMILLLMAGLNALVFHRYILKSTPADHTHSEPPAAARFSAVISISLWLAIIACGRLLAY